MKIDSGLTRRIRKRLLPLAMSLAMVLSMLPAGSGTVWAAETADVGTFEDFITAVSDENVDTINVIQDIDLEGDVTIERPVSITADPVCIINADTRHIIIAAGGDVTLSGDLVITGSNGRGDCIVKVQNGGALTLAGSASVTSTSTEILAATVKVEGALTLTESAAITGPNSENGKGVLLSGSGIVTVNGGVITTAGDYGKGIDSAGTVIVNGGTITASGYNSCGIILNDGGTAAISGGSITASGPVSSGVMCGGNGSATVSDNAVITASGSESRGIYISEGTAVVSGGAITGNGTACIFTINGGQAVLLGGAITANAGYGVFMMDGGMADIIVSEALSFSGRIVGAYDSAEHTLLTGLPEPAFMTVGEEMSVELAGVGEGITFTLAGDTDDALGASISGSAVTLAPPDDTVAGEYKLVLTAGSGDILTLTIPVAVQLFDGGTGVESDPYEIADAYQLNNVRKYPEAFYILTEDIDLTDYLSAGGTGHNSGAGWAPIGTDSTPLTEDFDGTPFTGVFDGNDKIITGLYINRPEENYIGLFGDTDAGAVIQDVGLAGIDVTGAKYVGGLAGNIVGSSVTGCSASGSVEGSQEDSQYMGGLFGNAGGATIEDSYAEIDVTGGFDVGGLAGNVIGSNVADCYSTGRVEGGGWRVGGLIGGSYNGGGGSITGSYATGGVLGNADVGGLVGYNDSSITDCYALGSAEKTLIDWGHVGGLVGFNENGTITNTYAAGAVQGPGGFGYVGGLAGDNSGGTVAYSFYNSQTTRQPDNSIGTPLTSAEMVRKDNFTGSGWDFTTGTGIWAIIEGTSYPFLQAHVPDPLPAPPAATPSGGGGGGRTIAPPVPSGGVKLEIPANFLANPGAGRTVTLNSNIGSITIPSNMLAGMAGAEGKKAEIIIGQGDKSNLPDEVKDAIGGRPLISLSLTLDGVQTDWNNPDASVTVSIPYTPTAEELANPEGIVIWYIDGGGKPQCITNGHYDPATGAVTVDVTHFSDYAVVYNPVSFRDVPSSAWYYRAVSFIAARDITTGTGSGNFSPGVKLTRGQFLVMLMKAYEIAPDAQPKDNFADAGSTYYTGYLATAKRLGISGGVGNNTFAPAKEITRQEMFTLLYNALKVMGQLPEGTGGKPLSDFSDASQIDEWAREAMTAFAVTGAVGGSNGKLAPTGTTTRAEMAQVLYNLLGK